MTTTTHPQAQYAIATLNCPKCGSVPDPSAGPNNLARCRSCGTIGRIDDPKGGQRRLVAEPGVDLRFARQSLQDEFGESAGQDVTLHRSELLFVPFWHVRSVLLGHVSGLRKTTTHHIQRETNLEGVAVYQRVEQESTPRPFSRDVQKVHHALISACPLEELGVPTLDRHQQVCAELSASRTLDGQTKLSCFDAQALRARGTLIDPVVSLPEATEQADELLSLLISGLGSTLLPGAKIRSALVERDVVLVYHPVYLLTFQLRGQRGRAAIDGVTGQVVHCDRPKDDTAVMEKRILGFAALLGGAVTGALVRGAAFAPGIMQGLNSDARTKLFVAGALVGTGVIAGLRYLQREMEKGS